MKEFMQDWNSHKIRANEKSTVRSGIPIDMYEMPQIFGKYNELTCSPCSLVIQDMKITFRVSAAICGYMP